MTRRFQAVILCALLAAAPGGVSRAETEQNLEQHELGRLATAAERLASVFEQEAKARVEEREAQRIQVLVAILGMRYRKVDELESETRSIESEEENLRSEITLARSRLETMEQPGRSPEEVKPQEKEVKTILENQIKVQEEHAARLAERKALAQGDLAGERKRLVQLEAILEDWVSKQR